VTLNGRPRSFDTGLGFQRLEIPLEIPLRAQNSGRLWIVAA
jgi:hypothetical protein